MSVSLFLAGFLACSGGTSSAPEPLPPPKPTVAVDGLWRGWLEGKGGVVPFGFRLDGSKGVVLNGGGEDPIDRVLTHGSGVELHFDRYGSWIEAELQGDRLDGNWHVPRTGGVMVEVPFHAERGYDYRFSEGHPPGFEMDGRWEVQFSTAKGQPAVGLFTSREGEVEGTILTATGDYRYLSGSVAGKTLRLSTFDGAHAFLFLAREEPGGRLNGNFWSGTWWHEPFWAARNEAVALPDAFAETEGQPVELGALSFLDAEGKKIALDAPQFAATARIVEVFGTWCPNCNDATDLLVDLQAEYGKQGLGIVGVAFERSGSPERDRRQLDRYAKTHGITYPLLLGGISNKDEASKAFPLVDRVRSFPTTVFIDAEQKVRAVHSGFVGPAAPEEHAALVAKFRSIIEDMLIEGG